MKKIRILLITLAMILTFAACDNSTLDDDTAPNTSVGEDAADTKSNGIVLPPAETTSAQNLTVGEIGTGSAAKTSTDLSNRDLSGEWDASEARYIELKESMTITEEGVYVLSGTFTGQIIVEADDTAKIQLVLNGVNITSNDGPAIYIKTADKVFITLEEGSKNTLSDSITYTLAEGEDEPNAAIFSKCDLTINGTGSLTVNGNYRHGILTKDDLAITGGVLNITAKEHGIRGRDSVEISGGAFIINAGEDGIQSNNDTDTEKGYIIISGGSFDITAGNDGIQAETTLAVTGGTGTIKTGGTSSNAAVKSGEDNFGKWGGFGNTQTTTTEDTVSTKGIKAGASIYLDNCSFTIDSEDDSVHSNANIDIDSAVLSLSSGDDGIHADSILTINGGEISVLKSYEGLEGLQVIINGGKHTIYASDDGINAAGGSSDTAPFGGGFGGGTITDGEYKLEINGGDIYINVTTGDGVDSNGNLFVNGGTIIIDGTSAGGNSAIDYDGGAAITSGKVIATGNSSMAMNFGSTSTQASIMYTFTSNLAAGTTISLRDDSGSILLSTTTDTAFNNVVFSSPEIEIGKTYSIYSSEEKAADIEVTQAITSNGSNGMGGGMGGMRPSMDGDMGDFVPSMDGQKPNGGMGRGTR